MLALISPLLLASILVTSNCLAPGYGSENEHMRKVLVLSKRFQEILYLSDNSQSVYNMREVFYPSYNYRFWQPDNIMILDIDICLYIEQCPETKSTNYTKCSVYRWTNSYFLNMIDIRQLYGFELLTTSTLFGTIARGHTERLIQLTLNVPCDGLNTNTIDETIISQALVVFLSWVKVYAQSPGSVPELWDGNNQGYVVLKYDYTTVDLFHFDDLSDMSYKTTLVAFILFNLLIMYLLASNASNINTCLCAASSKVEHISHITKGLILMLSLMVPCYFIGTTTFWIKDDTLKLSVACEEINRSYSCVPNSDFEMEHNKQVLSQVASWAIKVVVGLLYAMCSVYVVKTARTQGIVFQRGWLKCIEVFLLWNGLMGIHVVVGFAGIPILIFAILIPMYTVFFISASVLGLGALLLLFAIAFYLLDLIKRNTLSKFQLCLHALELGFVYSVVTGVTMSLSIFYYIFLTGGADMAGVKGIIFSLVPPLLISVALVIIKRKLTVNNKERKTIEYLEDEPLIGL